MTTTTGYTRWILQNIYQWSIKCDQYPAIKYCPCHNNLCYSCFWPIWTAKEKNKKNIPSWRTCFLLHSSIIHVNKPTLQRICGTNCKWYDIASVINMVESTPNILISSKHQSADYTHFWYDALRYARCVSVFIHKHISHALFRSNCSKYWN